MHVESIALSGNLDAGKLQRIPSNVQSHANVLLGTFPLHQQLDVAELQRILSDALSPACMRLEELLS